MGDFVDLKQQHNNREDVGETDRMIDRKTMSGSQMLQGGQVDSWLRSHATAGRGSSVYQGRKKENCSALQTGLSVSGD